MKVDIIDRTIDYITAEAVDHSAARLIAPGAVVCVLRSGILKHTFPVAVNAVAVTVNQDLRALTPRRDINPYYLAQYLRFAGDEVLAACSKDGTTVNSIDAKALNCLAVPVAPLEIQRRIVERIDALFTNIADGETALWRARVGLDSYRRALLKAAVTGELTRTWRQANSPSESGADLVKRIQHTGGFPKRIIRDPTVTQEIAEQWNLPKGWVVVRLGDIFRVFVGATPSRREPRLWDGSIPWVSSGEVAFCRIAATRETISAAAVDPGRVHPKGTVLLGMIGEGRTRGQAAILDVAAAHNQNCASIRVSETPIPPEYVFEYLHYRYEKTRKAGSGGNQPALNKARVQEIPIPLPPLVEILEITRRFRLFTATATEREMEFESISERFKGLRQSVLSAAFRGDLAE
jgi:type I restriction enzyme S subunit